VIKITEIQAYYLSQFEDAGYYGEFGCCIGDAKFVIVDENNELYLAHISEFTQDGFFVKLKK
jgi:hypothetical protein